MRKLVAILGCAAFVLALGIAWVSLFPDTPAMAQTTDVCAGPPEIACLVPGQWIVAATPATPEDLAETLSVMSITPCPPLETLVVSDHGGYAVLTKLRCSTWSYP